MANMALEEDFEGHDHNVYEVSKTYTGSNFIHIAKAPIGTLVGSSRVQHISVHVDDLKKLIEMMQRVMNG